MHKSDMNYAAVISLPELSQQFMLGIKMDQGELISLDYLQSGEPYTSVEAEETVAQLRDFVCGWSHDFSIKFRFDIGTPFQQKVWLALADIPYGETETYGALAQRLGSSARAVGGACRRNPLPVILPCHRVVAANHLGGYSGERGGEMLKIKQRLLELEKEVQRG